MYGIPGFDPMRGIMFDSAVLTKASMKQFVYGPLGGNPTETERKLAVTIKFVNTGYMLPSSYVTYMRGTGLDEDLHKVATQYRFCNVLNTFNKKVIEPLANYYLVDKLRGVYEEEEPIPSRPPRIEDLNYTHDNLIFLHRLYNGCVSNHPKRYMGYIAEYIHDLIENRISIRNLSFCSFLQRIIINHNQKDKIKLVRRRMDHNPFCFSIDNEKKEACLKHTRIEICLHCHCIINVMIKGRKKPDKCSNSKKNIHKSTNSTDFLIPTKSYKCSEKANSCLECPIFSYDVGGCRLIDIVWNINSNINYVIYLKVSDGCIYVDEHKKKNQTVFNLGKIVIPFNTQRDCFEILKEGEEFDLHSCDLCRLKAKQPSYV